MSVRPALVLWLVACVLFAVNLLGSILPSMNPDGDACRTRVGPLAGIAGSRDLVVVDRIHGVEHCVNYITGANGASLDDLLAANQDDPFDALRSRVARTRSAGGHVWIDDSVLRPGAAVRGRHGDRVDDLALRIRQAYASEWTPRVVGGAGMLVLVPSHAGP